MANKQNFIGMLLPHALEASKVTGIDPRIIIAQGALESNWGKSAPGNNFFGIKSHGQSGGNTFATNEVINGKQVRIKDSFRAYESPGESVQGYAEFITKNPRYKNFRSAQGLDNQIAELGKSGYATDPSYTNKISSIAQGININGPMMGSMAVPDGVKGQEAYPQPVMLADSKPAAERPIVNVGGDNYKTPIVPGAVKNMAGMEPRKNGIADVFSLMALQGAQPQQQVQAAPIQGPTPEQANALNQALMALRKRMV